MAKVESTLMRILYLSCHSVLEADEIKLFTELGHEVFSMGAYQTGNNPNNLRGSIPGLYDNSHLREISLGCSKENLHPELIEWCDAVVMMHNSRVDIKDHPQPWLANNWDKFKKAGKPVVWRAIGQSTRQIEKSLQEFRKKGLKIVRYSPLEKNIPGFAGEDCVIRFYKDPDEYTGYNGQVARVVNVSQALFGNIESGGQEKSRGDHMNLELFEKIVKGLDWRVFGPDNEDAGEHNGGALAFEDLKTMLRFNRVYLYMGTRPASYTLALIEAMMTGTPVISVGHDTGNSIYVEQKTFEVPDILGENGDAGFWSDSSEELHKYCKQMLEDPDKAFKIGQKGRALAVNLFGKNKIGKQWDEFLRSLL